MDYNKAFMSGIIFLFVIENMFAKIGMGKNL